MPAPPLRHIAASACKGMKNNFINKTKRRFFEKTLLARAYARVIISFTYRLYIYIILYLVIIIKYIYIIRLFDFFQLRLPLLFLSEQISLVNPKPYFARIVSEQILCSAAMAK